MKLRQYILIALTFLLAANLNAAFIFLNDGNVITSQILDMSSRTGMVDLQNGMKINRSRIWMINFVNNQWNFPNERNMLSGRHDYVFMRNGQAHYGKVADYSSRRHNFEFSNGFKIPVGQVARVYFCCLKLPAAYSQQQQRRDRTPQRGSRFQCTTFLMDGRTVGSPIQYLNNRKSGFEDGLQINTKDIWMINFVEDKFYYPDELRDLDRRVDSIFLAQGEVVYDTVVGFDSRTQSFQFRDGAPIHFSRINRIYFCCNPLPEALKRRGVRRNVRRRH